VLGSFDQLGPGLVLVIASGAIKILPSRVERPCSEVSGVAQSLPVSKTLPAIDDKGLPPSCQSKRPSRLPGATASL
jgi:hypothetical protein